ncbi:MAG: hypothetical protein V2A77_00390 [Pseudomonadota bacterium]
MPLQDYGEAMGGGLEVQGLLERDLSRYGYEILDQARLKRVLLRERVRGGRAITRELVRMIGNELGTRLILSCSVTQYGGGDDPCCGVAAHLTDTRTGRIVWSGAASSSGSEHETLLGLGRVKEPSKLAEFVVSALLKDLPPPEEMAAHLGRIGD